MKKKETILVFDLPIPNTEELERNVLADAICAPEFLGDVIPVINPEFFTSDSRRRIWDIIVDRYNKGEDISFSLMEVVGDDFQTEVLPNVSEAGLSGTPFRAMLLRDGAARRRAYLAAGQFLKDAINPGITEQDILASLGELSRAVEGPSPLNGEKHIAAVLEDVREEIGETAKTMSSGGVTRITTGFRTMDMVLNGGYKGGQLIVLAARPSVGKTALMLQMAKSAASSGNPVQVFSLEMTAVELAERILYSTGEVRPFEVNNGLVDMRRLGEVESKISGMPFYINDFSRSLDDIVSRLTQAVNKGRCKIAFIDYLGLFQDAVNPSNGAKLYQVIARITGTLKSVAKRLRIPIVLLCQINRESARENRSPQLYDLRDSGSIEQDADIVLMLESKVQSEGKLYVWLRKHRAGKKEVGFVLTPNDTYSSFAEESPVDADNNRLPPPPEPENGRFDFDENNDNNDNDLPF